MSHPRKIPPTLLLDEAEAEVFFTRSGLKADPDAHDLLFLTDGWLAMIEVVRTKERSAREAQADADAARTIANTRLDRACQRFGDELFLAVGKERGAARWSQFFSVPVSKFIRQALPKQVARVIGWLDSKDPILDKHRAGLEPWAKAADAALKRTTAVATVRGEARIGREELAEGLTRERDGLHEALSARARERGLPRDWAGQFFRKVSRAGAASEEGDETAAG
ncbi:hypothetical protein [Polyangium jinanense]|uniref:Uncharacterized protein n=1 Tax=Polyangium jinanense TaxID=2829994 RepID=A0A9X4AQJ5_9BACT|nr:hypothetical protein [Polyangium jinanense]MDC3955072.1 hypothetical protein [Polyangium jinanense]MDC3981158.1 hypothetical protein [Polyangium jinanense]